MTDPQHTPAPDQRLVEKVAEDLAELGEGFPDVGNLAQAYLALSRQGVPGVMHAVDKAFYDLTVKQRDAAWCEVEALTRQVNMLMEVCDELAKILGATLYQAPGFSGPPVWWDAKANAALNAYDALASAPIR